MEAQALCTDLQKKEIIPASVLLQAELLRALQSSEPRYGLPEMKVKKG